MMKTPSPAAESRHGLKSNARAVVFVALGIFLAGCVEEGYPRDAGWSKAPYAPAYSVSGGMPPGAVAVQGGGPAAAATWDPYCREAVAEARAASRDARRAARDARISNYTGAPPWAQAQDSERASDAASRADRARAYAARDC